MSRSGDSYQHFPHLLLCIRDLKSYRRERQNNFTSFHASGVNSFRFMISLKICLTMSLVSSSHALMSSARIPLLSGDLPFLSLLIAVRNSSVVISGVLFSSSHWCCCCAHRCCFHCHSLRFLVQIRLARCRRIFFVGFSKDIGNPFTRRDDLSFLILYLCDEHLLLCRFDSWYVPYTFEVFKYSLDVLLSFHSFFCP